jgi:NADH-quinone oxidoreductase subunit N
VIYSGLTILLFSTLIFAIVSQKNFPAYIANWTSSGLRNYIFTITFALILFSMSGIPPLAGFFSKLAVLLSIIANEFYITALVIVIVSSVASFYYIRLIKTFFFIKTRKDNFWISSSTHQNMEFNIGILLFLNVAFWIHPETLSLFSTVIGLVLF